MKKIYISPAIDIYNVNIRSGIMGSPGTAGSEVDPSELPGLTPDVGGNPGDEGGWDNEDNSRSNGGNSIWDNAW